MLQADAVSVNQNLESSLTTVKRERRLLEMSLAQGCDPNGGIIAPNGDSLKFRVRNLEHTSLRRGVDPLRKRSDLESTVLFGSVFFGAI